MSAVTTIDLSSSATLKLALRGGCGGILTCILTRDGVALNITGASIKYVANLATVITKTVGVGITITDGPGGVFALSFAEADTTGQNENRTVPHECKIQPIGEEPQPVFDGTLTVKESIFAAMV